MRPYLVSYRNCGGGSCSSGVGRGAVGAVVVVVVIVVIVRVVVICCVLSIESGAGSGL